MLGSKGHIPIFASQLVIHEQRQPLQTAKRTTSAAAPPFERIALMSVAVSITIRTSYDITSGVIL
jgi:hypothetical protein